MHPPSPNDPLFRTLEGFTAVVTGSSSGIGRAIAERLAQSGARVLVHGFKNEDGASSCAQICRDLQKGSSNSNDTTEGLDYVLSDLSQAEGRSKLLNEAQSKLGKIDIWINNAGADVITDENSQKSFEQKLELLWKTDVEATILLSRAIGKIMLDAGSGVILNMGWDQAQSGMEGDSGEYFSASKGAVMAFSKSLALSLAPKVRVNTLAPGWIKTAWGEKAEKYWNERVLKETPAQRWGRPEDVAHVAHHLVSPGSSYLTGQTIAINGGAVR